MTVETSPETAAQEAPVTPAAAEAPKSITGDAPLKTEVPTPPESKTEPPVQKGAGVPEDLQATEPAPEGETQEAGTFSEFAGEFVEANPDLASVFDVLDASGTSGQTVEQIFSKAMESGNPADVNRALLEAAVGKSQAALIMTQVEAYASKVQSQNTAVTEAIHGAVGGAEAWDNVTAWAKVNLSQPEIDQAIAGMNSSPLAAAAIAKDLFSRANAASGASETSSLLAPNAVLQSSVTPMGKQEYAKAYAIANRKGDTHTMKLLDRQRAAGVRAGIK